MLKIIIPPINDYESTFNITDSININKIVSFVKTEGIEFNIINLNSEKHDKFLNNVFNNKNLSLLTVHPIPRPKGRGITDSHSRQIFGIKNPPLRMGYSISQQNPTQGVIFNNINTDININNKIKTISKLTSELIARYKLNKCQTILYFQPYYKENLLFFLFLLKKLKSMNSSIKIICFGHYFFSKDIYLMKKYKFIDYILSINSKDAIVKIIKNIEPQKIKGITYREKNKILKNAHSSKVFDNTNNDLFIINNNFPIIPLEMVSGCKFNCFFCENKGFNLDFEFKNINTLIKEIKKAKEKNIKGIWFRDPAINFDEKLLILFCKKLIEENLKIKWSAPFIPYNIKSSTINLMSKSGCVHARIGIETFNAKIQKILKKNITENSVIEMLNLLKENNITSSLGFMIGIPQESKYDQIKKLTFIRDNIELIESVKFYIFQIRKGAPICNLEEFFEIKILPDETNERFIKYETKYDKWHEIQRRNQKILNLIENELIKLNISIDTPEKVFIKLIRKTTKF